MTKRVVTLGEIMLRLKPVGFERFFQSPTLEATFGGGEGMLLYHWRILAWTQLL